MAEGDAVAGRGAPEPEMRIGTVERESAAKALDEHLNAGRLGVEEYADRSARAANATVAHELTELFTDLPAPHPVLPGTTQAVPAAAGVERRDRPGGLEVWGPRLVAASPIIALVLFLVTHQWWFFLLVPLCGALFYGSRGRRRDEDRDARRAERDRRRDGS